MAILKSFDGNEIIISCKCGCDEGIRVKVDHDVDNEDVWYQTYVSGNWYKEQGRLIDKIKKIWAIIRNKDFYYSEIVLNKEEWNMYKEWINSR